MLIHSKKTNRPELRSLNSLFIKRHAPSIIIFKNRFFSENSKFCTSKSGKEIKYKIIKNATPLHRFGIYEWAWDKQEAINVINSIKDQNIGILGGNLYSLTTNNLESLSDNWSCDITQNESNKVFFQRSKEISLEYIENYPVFPNENIVFSIFFITNSKDIRSFESLIMPTDLITFNCRVCGMSQKTPPYGDNNQNPTHEICPCCGTDFGYDDETPALAKKYREDWLKKGAPWFCPDEKPENWSLEKQLTFIPKDFC